ncbi:MAG TPA: response regulator [Armatimonadota bacterium]|jgi:DNA-binding NtrC family response regulator
MGTVLVVDDEEEVRLSIKRRLEREGYTVSTAASQEEGCNALGNATPPYDVVVTDMLMEEQESGQAILKAAVTADLFTEVIVLTAHGNVNNAVECMRLGAFDYLEKNIPGVDVYDLLTMKVRQAMDRRKQSLGTVRRLEGMGIYGKGPGAM